MLIMLRYFDIKRIRIKLAIASLYPCSTSIVNHFVKLESDSLWWLSQGALFIDECPDVEFLLQLNFIILLLLLFLSLAIILSLVAG